MTGDDYTAATRYLRGEMNVDESFAFEARFASDGRLCAVISMAEDELLDRYISGDLDGGARLQLARRLELDAGFRRHLTLIGALFSSAGRLSLDPPGRRWWWLRASPRAHR